MQDWNIVVLIGFEFKKKYNSLTASVGWETHDKNGRLISFLVKAIPVST